MANDPNFNRISRGGAFSAQRGCSSFQKCTPLRRKCDGNSSHTISLRQTERWKTGETITAAVYEYLVDNDGEWGELRFDFENGTAEIVKLADWDTVKSNGFAKTAIRYIQGLPEARLLKSVVVPFWKGRA